MKANELRVGNWVFDQDCEPYYFQVEQIRKDIGNDLWIYYRNGSIKCKEPDVVSLTEEILLKCGFELNNERTYFEHKKCGLKLMDIVGLYYRANFPIKADIKYLHQLQNLYFALTQKELIIDL